MQFSARFNTVEARGAKLDGDGERIYVLFGKAGAAAVVAADAFEALYEPKDPIQIPAPPQAETPLPFKFNKAPKKKTSKPSAVAMPSGDDKPSARILAALARGPQSFTELMNNCGLAYPQAQPACKVLEAKGKIIAIKDPNDPTETKRYKLA